MKANEAPEKLYFSQIEDGTHYYTEGIPFERDYVEYIRKDAFIEKACKFLYEQLNNGTMECGNIEEFIEDFKSI